MPAPWAYFDTSVLLKRYVRETGSAQARASLRRYRFLSSAIAPVEAMSALCRRRTSGELAEEDFTAILSRIRKDRDYWELVAVTPLVLSHAEVLIETTRAKTLDALHLASALAFQAMSGIRIPFITADIRQRDAASRLDLTVIEIDGGPGRVPGRGAERKVHPNN
ncbi:Ribonuclease VapC46 [Candidatus Methylomirabilis lanthanidiphila]|uniref:Ribonuclease VapC46 n=1 Tax=Candidatus Methylomirabilis lanthanidiphila TaxID=2211376 RepID=A0A564ZG03_9BACT|nr:type II toxin-antitoxin system VapC family toxin [Candidatus Methylomirabilis lanthanidiphila]VUZ84249.1 Ribonuclease VapC46 [Candidatus Methylomirabilis lanthanidiphila]